MILVTWPRLSLCGLCFFGWFALPPSPAGRVHAVPDRDAARHPRAAWFSPWWPSPRATSGWTRTGLRIRNGLARHHVEWSQVHKFLLRPGDPWAIVLIKPDDRPFEVDLDAEKRQLMGIQAGDGAGSRRGDRDVDRAAAPLPLSPAGTLRSGSWCSVDAAALEDGLDLGHVLVHRGGRLGPAGAGFCPAPRGLMSLGAGTAFAPTEPGLPVAWRRCDGSRRRRRPRARCTVRAG